MENQKVMSYDEAIEILGFTTPKSLEDNALLAYGLNQTATCPLRYKVARSVVIRAAELVRLG